MSQPPKSILSKDFKYVNAASTSVGATFRRIRRELKEADERQAAFNREALEKIAGRIGGGK